MGCPCMETKLIYLVQAGLHFITESLSYVTVSLIYLDACASVCGHDVININAYVHAHVLPFLHSTITDSSSSSSSIRKGTAVPFLIWMAKSFLNTKVIRIDPAIGSCVDIASFRAYEMMRLQWQIRSNKCLSLIGRGFFTRQDIVTRHLTVTPGIEMKRGWFQGLSKIVDSRDAYMIFSSQQFSHKTQFSTSKFPTLITHSILVSNVCCTVVHLSLLIIRRLCISSFLPRSRKVDCSTLERHHHFVSGRGEIA